MVTIYGRPNSSNVQKVLWACDELGVAYELKLTGLAHGGTGEDWYRAMNPNGLVPVLVDKGEAIWESNTILRYLAAAYGAGTLWSADPLERSRAERWMDWQLSTLAPPTSIFFYGLVRAPEAERDHARIDRALAEAADCWALVDRHLEGRTWLAGDRFGLAELALGMYAYRWTELAKDRPGLPNLTAWYARLRDRQPFRTHVMQPLT